MTSRQPDALVRWLFRVVEARLTLSEAEFLGGDLYEEWQRRSANRGRAILWLAAEVAGLAFHGRLHFSPQTRRHPRKEPIVRGLFSSLTSLLRDFSYALRRLGRSPGSSALVIGTLAVGIGLNTLVFMFADALLLRPLPYAEPERLVVIETNTGGPGWYGSSEPELLDLESVEGLESIGAWSGESVVMVESGSSRRVRVALATAELLPTLGIAPLLGRFFDSAEDQPGADRVVLVSHRFWQSELGGTSDVLEKSLDLNGRLARVIGVMPASFRYPSPRFDLWTPLRIDRSDPWARNNHYLTVVARRRSPSQSRERDSCQDGCRQGYREWTRSSSTTAFWSSSCVLPAQQLSCSDCGPRCARSPRHKAACAWGRATVGPRG